MDMITEKVRVITEDRLIMEGLLYKSDKKSKNIVINVHGTAGNFYTTNFIDEMAKKYTDSSIDFMPMNNRGHDYISEIQKSDGKGSKLIGYTYEKFTDCVYDIKAYVDFAVRKGYKNIILQGHSLGAVKCAYYMASKTDNRVKGLIFASPPDMIGLGKVEGNTNKIGKDLFSINRKNFHQIISSETLKQLRKKDSPADIFSTYDIKKRSILERIRQPIFAFFGDTNEATIMESFTALKIIREKASSCKDFTYKVFKGANHIYLGHEKEVASSAANWVKEKLN